MKHQDNDAFFEAWKQKIGVFFRNIYLWHIKTVHFLVRKLKKDNIFEIWILFTLYGHKIGVMSTIKVVIWILWLFIALLDFGMSKTKFFWSGSSKKAIFLKFDHFSLSMWSSNCGHEHYIGSHMNPIVHYNTVH